ncbi:MAG: nucleotidyltransferase family protein [Deltaproteobacteria bacterium]|nr:nucleotidyltransferase family protein [Deltaproteobacteria bacterium]
MDENRIKELLVSCLRREDGSSKIEKLSKLSTPDWETIVKSSIRHDLAPLFYHRLKPLIPEIHLPASIADKLREIYLRSVARNIRMYKQLSEFIMALWGAGIQVIPLKGAHLAKFVYGNVALRPMSDVDLLVRRENMPKVCEILVGKGYTHAGHLNIHETCEVFQHLPPFEKPGGLAMELHWNLETPTYPLRIDVEGLWERAQISSLDGIDVPTLSPEDQLLHLCLHVSLHHGFANGLKALCDINEIIERYRGNMDWGKIIDRSQKWAANKCVFITMLQAKNLIGAPVPDAVLNQLKPEKSDYSNMEALSKELIFRGGTNLSPHIARLWGQYRGIDKLKIFIKRVFPVIEEMAAMYPVSSRSMKVYLYYPNRLKDLLFRHGRHVKRLFLHDQEMSTCLQIGNMQNRLKDWLL